MIRYSACFVGFVLGVIGFILWVSIISPSHALTDSGASASVAQSQEAVARDVWWRQARYVRVIDGDTIEVIVDLGYGVQIGHDPRLRIGLRILRIDTPETNAREPDLRARAAEATAFTRAWPETRCGATAETAWPIHIRTEVDDSFGRYLAEVRCANSDASLGDDLLAAGLATVWED